MMTLTTLNSTAQVTLHHAIRARGMSCYLSSMALGMALGAWCWGWVTKQFSIEFAELTAAATLPIFAIIGVMLPIDAPAQPSTEVKTVANDSTTIVS